MASATVIPDFETAEWCCTNALLDIDRALYFARTNRWRTGSVCAATACLFLEAAIIDGLA